MNHSGLRIKIIPHWICLISLVAFGLAPGNLLAGPSLGLAETIVSSKHINHAFHLVSENQTAGLWCDSLDYKGVLRAIGDLQIDIERVTGKRPQIFNEDVVDALPVIIGTLGKNAFIDGLAHSGKLDVRDLEGKWESFVITTINNPKPGIKQALVIVGSDKRGAIYGIYELSEQLGVSPWYWWADVPVKKRGEAYIIPGRYASGEPAVKYRGIFLNDEWPCLGRWTEEKFGGMNSKFYTKVFELLLRLRANYLWPAMWNSAFNEDDPENPRLADEYGIVMGTSHHEPMMRAHKEWTKRSKQYGNGQWNYATNKEALKVFFREGISRNKKYENLITIGMRGDGDEEMVTTGSLESDIKLLEGIMADQRKIIADEMKTDPATVPQLWALFTEVKKFYEAGLRVPDDVTLLWTDDNNGMLRRLPTPEERNRKGGAGIYYHFDMHGGPFSYQWINTNPFPKIWEQMNLAHQYGANRIWIVNVGDLKPLELPIEFFLRMAWNPDAMIKEEIFPYTQRWAEREFGPEHATEIAEIVSRYAKYNGWRKPELITPYTYSAINFREAERVEAVWQDVSARAEALYNIIPAAQKDAFYQLALHPAKASAIVVQMQIAAGRNLLYARQGRLSANTEANRVRALFKEDQALSDYYNKELAGGKWNHLMDQTHLGQYDWQPPRVNSMPAVSEILPADNDNYGVAIEGDDSAWPDHWGDAVLPVFDSFQNQRSYVEVFAEGTRPISFEISANKPWIVLTKDTVSRLDQRYWVEIDWEKAPVGQSSGVISITGKREPVMVHVKAIKASKEQVRQAKGRFASLAGPISIAVQEAAENIEVRGVKWEKIPDYGRREYGMSVFPVTTKSVLPPQQAPQLEYPVFMPKNGSFEVTLILSPVMDFVPDRGMRIAIFFDDETPQVLDIFADREAETFLSENWWSGFTKDNARVLKSSHSITTAGPHTLKIRMVDPGIVLEKVMISDRPLPPSYFGPPEDKRIE
ncbi:MAG: glycosyl hydrolase 115 family protein [Calditrichaceae bacterium]|nr:glycosyl hydrolase 115 family protein [Calditrichaceae bacterium]